MAKGKCDVHCGSESRREKQGPCWPHVDITFVLWNVAESGCEGANVNIKNISTYPGAGDQCSSYGNRNFFREFQTFFDDTGGIIQSGPTNNKPVVLTGRQQSLIGGVPGLVPVVYSGNVATVPANPQVRANVVGKLIVTPNAKVAAGIAAGLAWLGEPYSGGVGADGPSLGICGPDGAENDCNIDGFDCSGLTRYIGGRYDVTLPQVSSGQRYDAHSVPWAPAHPGDLESEGEGGGSGHITTYIGTFDGVKMRLEAPYSGVWVRIAPIPMGTVDPGAYRWWTGAAA